MSVFAASERIPGINITLGESMSISTAMMARQNRGRHTRSVSEATRLPPAVAAVPVEHIRGYVHSKRVNNYLVGSTLGEGSFAKVKEGFHVLVGEKVAMKIIDKKKAQQDPYVAKNFRREAKLLQMVRHPNIVQLYEVIETDSSFYLISELCSGGELMKYIYKKHKLDENETRKFMRQIVSAVDHLHKAGIIHRDLKVENMLLDSNMDIKLIDFGLSNEEFVEGEHGLVHCNTQCGSPAYAAPELLGHKDYSKEVDIWSIGVNMYAMLTGCLPYTVEPFNITALHAKMLENKMNPIPDYLSTDCKDLLQHLLRSNPSERIKMEDIIAHPWMYKGHPLPFHTPPFPNKLKLTDISDDIVDHMVHTLKIRDSTDELKHELLSNRASSASAVYHLLTARLIRYQRQLKITHLRRTSRPRYSVDQGFYEAEDNEDTSSITSAPVTLRPHRTRRSTSPSTRNDVSRMERPISFPPPQDTDSALTAVQAPSSNDYADRRKSMPTSILGKEIINFNAKKKEKEAIKRKREIYDGRKAATLPRKFSLSSSSPKESPTQHVPQVKTHQKIQRTYSPPHDPYEYDFPSKTVNHPEVTEHDPAPMHPPINNASLTRNGYSHSHALNKIRRDLNSTLHPPNSVTKAWHSNPSTRTSSRNPSRHGSRNPSRIPSRAPSGASIRTPLSGSSHLEDILDDNDDIEGLIFHEVESHTLVLDSHGQRKRAFSIGADSTEMLEENDHLPSLPSPQHNAVPPPPTCSGGRRRAHSDVSGLGPHRNGFQSHTMTFDLSTDLDSDAIIIEFVRVAEQLKMRHLISNKSMVEGVLKGVRIQIHIRKDQYQSCHVTFQWVSGGELKAYREVCESFMARTYF